MKSQSNEAPLRVHDLRDGKSHFNYNVEESQDDEGNVIYKYDQVTVQNPVTRSKIVEALIREQYTASDEIALLRQQEVKSDDYKVYYDFVEQCKILADE